MGGICLFVSFAADRIENILAIDLQFIMDHTDGASLGSYNMEYGIGCSLQQSD